MRVDLFISFSDACQLMLCSHYTMIYIKMIICYGLFNFNLYFSFQIDINVNPRLPSEYINYLENPMEIVHEAELAAENGIWSLMQFTENLRRQYGKEPLPMEMLLKKLYVRRMAADLGITKIFASGKMVGMKTNMNKKVFKLITDAMTSDIHRNSLVFEGDQIKVIHMKSLTILIYIISEFLFTGFLHFLFGLCLN